MRDFLKVLLAVAALGLLPPDPAGAQVSDQCNLYPQSPGCPQYRPGQGYERNPRVGGTYPWEAPRYYPPGPQYYRQAPQYYQYAPQRRSGRRDLQYYCSLGDQTPYSIRGECRRYGYW